MSESLDLSESPFLHDFCSRETLAQELGVSTRTLDRWHIDGKGPPRATVGRTIRYHKDSVRAWLLAEETSGKSALDLRMSARLTRSHVPLREERARYGRPRNVNRRTRRPLQSIAASATETPGAPLTTESSISC